MDEFTPGNTDPERRGRVAYERYAAALPAVVDDVYPREWVQAWSAPWGMVPSGVRQMWCHAAEAAFEEGRAFELEQLRIGDISRLVESLRARGYRIYDPGTSRDAR